MNAISNILLVLAVACVSFPLLVSSQEYPKVRLEVYYEALCPGCQEFITGPLSDVLAMPDIVDITDLKMVPYGNTQKNSDGSFTCQHGVDECISDVYELCTMYKLSGNLTSIVTGETSLAAWPFVQCMENKEGDPSAAEGCFEANMQDSGLTWDDITTCFDKENFDVQNAGMAATPNHDYVPWVLVDGALLEYTNLLLPAICMAYDGPKPASCTAARRPALTADLCANTKK